jgi:hypothetical protein
MLNQKNMFRKIFPIFLLTFMIIEEREKKQDLINQFAGLSVDR